MCKEYLNKIVNVKIDRPLGSLHPIFKDEYPINYGYIPNTLAKDGKEIDAYILRVNKSLKTFKGKVVAVINRFDDVEFKLVVMPIDNCSGVTKEEIVSSTFFMEKFFKSKIILN